MSVVFVRLYVDNPTKKSQVFMFVFVLVFLFRVQSLLLVLVFGKGQSNFLIFFVDGHGAKRFVWPSNALQKKSQELCLEEILCSFLPAIGFAE